MSVLDRLKRLPADAERALLRRRHGQARLKSTKLDLRLDASTAGAQVRAQAGFSFRPQVAGRRFACLIGDVKLHSATCNGKPLDAKVNAPYLVMKFPKPLEPFVETTVQLKWSYRPDFHGTIYQPTTREECPERVWVTVRRPLLGLVQGRLVEGREDPPLRTYQWAPPRSRRLNLVVADVKSFKKDTPDGMSMWLHLHADSAERAPRILDLLLSLYQEAAESHHRKLPYADFHVIESDDRDVPAFSARGLIVVPRGTFRADDRPFVTGVLAPEFNKEWGRDPNYLVAEGQAD